MSEPWVILTQRYGAETRHPTPAKLAEAVAELYHETLPGMTEEDYAEHGAAWVRFGYDNGPMFVLTINRLGEARFEEWADQDFGQELANPRTMDGMPQSDALQLWVLLAQGDIDRIRQQRWH
jgi:hypothetical protein